MFIVWAIIGFVVAGALAQSWLAAFWGALAAAFLGHNISLAKRLRVMGEALAEARSEIRALRDHISFVTADVHRRLTGLEALPPAPTPAVASDPASPPAAEPVADAAPEPVPPLETPVDLNLDSALDLDPLSASPATPPAVPAGAAAVIAAAAQLEASLPEGLVPAAESPASGSEPAPVPTSTAPIQLDKPAPVSAPSQAAPPPAPRPPRPAEPSGPNALERGIGAAKNWLLGGNPVLRIGALLLFLGLAFLLRYATENMVVPIEIRYAGVALSAVVLLALGWFLRRKNRGYGLMLQGTGVAVMYLTIFAAMRLHPLLPVEMGFLLLVATAVFSAILAVTQNSVSLASAAALGGFAAPILASTGRGDHVALFSYFALLNLGILSIAWFKAWRTLNLIGFFGTFGIGFAWGLRSYRPELYDSTQPFLILFFAMYLLIGLLFARRMLLEAGEPPEGDRHVLLAWARQHANTVDGTTLFGTPLIGFGLQYALVRHLEFGAAFSALLLGAVYLGLAWPMLRDPRRRLLLLGECYLALGMIFATLAVPLALEARWTAAAWALEGAAIYWIGHRQQRPLARAFGLFLQLAAGWYYLHVLSRGVETLLDGPALGAVMLGAAYLFSYRTLRQLPAERQLPLDRGLSALLVVLGLSALYLLPPLLFDTRGAVMGWALAGVLTTFAGARLRESKWLWMAMLIQGVAGLVFVLSLDGGYGASGAALASGWIGMVTAAMLGGSAILCFVVASRQGALASPGIQRGFVLLLLGGLVVANLAFLFLLPWRITSAAWAASGLLIIWLSLQVQQRAAFGFGVLLQLVGGFTFLSVSWWRTVPGADQLAPLGHADFWAPLVIGLAAFVGAWRLHRLAQQTEPAERFALLRPVSGVLLVWGAAWWGMAWMSEIHRVLDVAWRGHAAVVVMGASVLAWLWLARRFSWAGMAALAALLLPVGILALLGSYHPYYHPLADGGWLAWGTLLLVHGLMLRRYADLLPAAVPTGLHVVGVWLLLILGSLEMRYLMLSLSDSYNAWRWLGWAVLPALYLLLMGGRALRDWWPVRDHLDAYRTVAAAPVAVLGLIWVWASSAMSSGAAQPLPYLPLLNPLEIGQLLTLLALFAWNRSQQRSHADWLIGSGGSQTVLLGSGLMLLTCMVFRTAHHMLDIPYRLPDLLASMTVQASLSIVWSLVALALMVAGNRRAQRAMWVCGAVLIAIVVAKLFIVELGNRGGLARVVSFIGVGVLLLVVGYFAPLPKSRSAADEPPDHDAADDRGPDTIPFERDKP